MQKAIGEDPYGEIERLEKKLAPFHRQWSSNRLRFCGEMRLGWCRNWWWLACLWMESKDVGKTKSRQKDILIGRYCWIWWTLNSCYGSFGFVGQQTTWRFYPYTLFWHDTPLHIVMSILPSTNFIKKFGQKIWYITKNLVVYLKNRMYRIFQKFVMSLLDFLLQLKNLIIQKVLIF